jgi:hypothetical protein
MICGMSHPITGQQITADRGSQLIIDNHLITSRCQASSAFWRVQISPSRITPFVQVL